MNIRKIIREELEGDWGWSEKTKWYSNYANNALLNTNIGYKVWLGLLTPDQQSQICVRLKEMGFNSGSLCDRGDELTLLFDSLYFKFNKGTKEWEVSWMGIDVGDVRQQFRDEYELDFNHIPFNEVEKVYRSRGYLSSNIDWFNKSSEIELDRDLFFDE